MNNEKWTTHWNRVNHKYCGKCGRLMLSKTHNLSSGPHIFWECPRYGMGLLSGMDHDAIVMIYDEVKPKYNIVTGELN